MLRQAVIPILVCVPLAAAAGPSTHPASAAVTGNEITPAQQRAVSRGLAHLARRQKPDGGYGSAGITALAGVAFMAGGSLPNRGAYGREVQRCLDYVQRCSQGSGLICGPGEHTPPMYGHGFATLFLGEVYGMNPDEELKGKLQKAVRLIAMSQNSDGGWRYQPIPFDADISVTICQVMALRAARDAGIKVDRGVIDRAVDYVKGCQLDGGGFAYMSGRGGAPGFARSAAGVATLFYAGQFDSNEVRRGLRYLDEADKAGEDDRYYFYGNYYAAQAMFLAGGDHWNSYYPRIREQLLARQDSASGGWNGEAGSDYATAMALIILQMPNRYLPVFHGKGPGN